MLDSVLIAFAVYRLTALIVHDVGPWGILQKQRDVFRRWTGALDCFRCVSLWLGCLFAAVANGFSLFWIYGLAYSAGAILIDAVVQYCRAHVQALGGQ